MQQAIYDVARPIVSEGKFLFTLGGEHSITPALVRAVAERYRPLSILQIDAHLDLRNEYQGTPYSHATAMRRSLDHVEVIVPVGIRTICAEEHAYLGDSGIKPFFAADCAASADWIDRAVARLTGNVYVTIDIDGFDPAFAPGTGTPEPGGLNWHQVIALLRKTAARHRVVAADLVEVLPLPGQAVTEFLAARLAYKLMAYVVAAETGTLKA
jgi:agmatinase